MLLLLTGKSITLMTSVVYDYNQFYFTVYERTNITFSVKACNDVHIALSTIPNIFEQQVMEFVIGGWMNSKSAIRNCKQCLEKVKVDTPNVLSCTEHRAFWISWSYGFYKVK
jgi:farsoic acid methyltransferase